MTDGSKEKELHILFNNAYVVVYMVSYGQY